MLCGRKKQRQSKEWWCYLDAAMVFGSTAETSVGIPTHMPMPCASPARRPHLEPHHPLSAPSFLHPLYTVAIGYAVDSVPFTSSSLCPAHCTYTQHETRRLSLQRQPSPASRLGRVPRSDLEQKEQSPLPVPTRANPHFPRVLCHAPAFLFALTRPRASQPAQTPAVRVATPLGPVRTKCRSSLVCLPRYNHRAHSHQERQAPFRSGSQ